MYTVKPLKSKMYTFLQCCGARAADEPKLFSGAEAGWAEIIFWGRSRMSRNYFLGPEPDEPKLFSGAGAGWTEIIFWGRSRHLQFRFPLHAVPEPK